MLQLKIAQVSTSDMSIFVLLLDQIKRLQKMGNEVVAVCSPGKWSEKIKKEGVKIVTIQMKREPSFLNDLSSLVKLYRLFQKEKFDIVHTHTPKAGLLAPVAAKLAGTPVVVHTIHGLLFHDRMPFWKRCIFWLPEKFTALSSDYLLSQSKEDIDVAVKSGICRAGKIFYLGNGIDTSRFSPEACKTARLALRQSMGFRDEDFIVGSFGRLVYEKGFSELFKAAKILIEKHANIKFLIIGPQEPDQSDAVSPKETKELEKTKKVYFLDWQKNMPEWYSAIDLFVLPSRREGVPRTCIEAGAMRKPVVTTNIRGSREVVLGGKTGLLVPLKDVNSLVKAIEKMLLDEPLRKQMGANARQHILKNFENRLVLERLENFYSLITTRIKKAKQKT